MIAQIDIRLARIEDCEGIYSLIKELAIFVKAEDRLKITAKKLEVDGFGEKQAFKAFVAEENAKIIGTAIFFENILPGKERSSIRNLTEENILDHSYLMRLEIMRKKMMHKE